MNTPANTNPVHGGGAITGHVMTEAEKRRHDEQLLQDLLAADDRPVSRITMPGLSSNIILPRRIAETPALIADFVIPAHVIEAMRGL